MHWLEFFGSRVSLTIPYKWWQMFNAWDKGIKLLMNVTVDAKIIFELSKYFEDFRKAYAKEGMIPSYFEHFGLLVHTLNQFITGYEGLLSLVRERML